MYTAPNVSSVFYNQVRHINRVVGVILLLGLWKLGNECWSITSPLGETSSAWLNKLVTVAALQAQRRADPRSQIYRTLSFTRKHGQS